LEKEPDEGSYELGFANHEEIDNDSVSEQISVHPSQLNPDIMVSEKQTSVVDNSKKNES